MGLKRIYLDTSKPPNGSLVVSNTNASSAQAITFIEGDTDQLEIWLLKPTATPTASQVFDILDITGYTCRVTVGNPGDSPLPALGTPTPDTNNEFFEGALALTSAEISAFVASTNETRVTLQIRVNDGVSWQTKFMGKVTLLKTLDDNVTAAPAPVDQYYDQVTTDGLFLKKVGPAGEGLILTSPDGSKKVFIHVDDDGNLLEDALQ